ncbi:MAG TPA: DUF5715 family protein [Pyrinomonadaceae bacterium]|nr:DUF5715 family protein [Pyrinomonadaceae bacterium]
MKRVYSIIAVVIIGFAVWTVRQFRGFKHLPQVPAQVNNATNVVTFEQWQQAVEKVKADRDESMRGGFAETPPELKHYDERYWFLATQIAEVARYNIPTCQDYFDLAAMLQRGEMVSVPGVTSTYVLYGVAQRVDDSEFTSEPGITPDYEPLQALAKNFGGRSYDLNVPADRAALKSNMLSSLRPPALKIVEEVADAYHRQFDRPLPVSSLVRPEQYQHALSRVNRNAVKIDTPPHSTGLAFDIDYRYMTGPEQTFVMAELARLKNAGRIEAIRERNANYHVFAFVNGTRPNDELISAKLEEAMPPGMEANHAVEKPKPKSTSQKVRNKRRRRR